MEIDSGDEASIFGPETVNRLKEIARTHIREVQRQRAEIKALERRVRNFERKNAIQKRLIKQLTKEQSRDAQKRKMIRLLHRVEWLNESRKYWQRHE